MAHSPAAGDPAAQLAAWREAARAELGGAEPETLQRETPEGIAIRPLYTAADLAELEHLQALPGALPLLRGPYPTMYRTRRGTVRHDAGCSTAEAANDFYRRGLAAGQSGPSVALGLAAHGGFDSGRPQVVGDVG